MARKQRRRGRHAPATEKQFSFVIGLYRDVIREAPTKEQIRKWRKASKRDVSAIIEGLLALRAEGLPELQARLDDPRA